MGMDFPDPMNPIHYQNVDVCKKLKELNTDLAKQKDKELLPVQKLLAGAAKGNDDTLYVYVPPMKTRADFQKLSGLLTTLQELGFTAVDTKGEQRNTVGSVYVIKNSEAAAICKANLVNAIMAINRALTGNPMLSSAASASVAMLQSVVKDPKLMALMNQGTFANLFM